MPRWLSRAVGTAVFVISTAAAQPPSGTRSDAQSAPVVFSTPDGSRFVLVPARLPAPVHWVVATLAGAAEDPPGLQGLAAAVQRASLGGTWTTGSRDADAERAALADLERAQADLLTNPGDPALVSRVQEAQALASKLGDPKVFARVLAAAPAHDPRVTVDDPVALLELTTVPSAIAEIGRLLVERREEQVLRGLSRHWLDEVAARQRSFDADPLAPVHAELLALAIPNHPATRSAQRPGRAMPTRSQAMAVWNATQHPSRTVHVLLGGFDPEAVRPVLMATFAATGLPVPPPRALPDPRPVASLRRSTVPGTGRSTASIAWVLPPIQDPFTLAIGARWLGDGSASQLGRMLRKQGRTGATVRCTAPWPVAVEGRSLLLIEVEDKKNAGELAGLVIAECRRLVRKPPARSALNGFLRAAHSSWSLVTADPGRLAAETARTALLWPGRRPSTALPMKVAPEEIQTLLAAVFAGQPVVVEATP